MADDFTVAPDFPPESEPWRRENEERTKNLEDQVEILLKNYRSLTRQIAAGTKATHLRISALGGVSIPPGTPINVQVYPYAYFTTNGYPAAGARIYWGDQNDADNYEIWIRRVTPPGSEEYSDFSKVQETQIATADVRGLECLTDYELMLRAVSPGGSYGFFTGTILFTTPNETTWIPSLGDPILQWHGNYASATWDYAPDYTPETVEPTEGLQVGATGSPTIPTATNLQAGVLAPNGFVYYPPADDGNGYIVNPEPQSWGIDWSVTSFALDPFGDDVFDYAGQGAVGADGKLYWVARASGEIEGEYSSANGALVRITPHPTEGSYIDGSVILIEDGAEWGGIAMTADGNLYACPRNPSLHSFLKISPTGTIDITSLSYTANKTYGRGITAANGDVWFMPTGTTDHFLVIDGFLGTVSTVPLNYTGFGGGGANDLHSPVQYHDGSIYAFGVDTWYRIEADGTQTHGSMPSGTLMRAAAVGADGKIRGMRGVTTSSTFYWVFDPETEVTTTESLPGGNWAIQGFTSSSDGKIVIVNDAQQPTSPAPYRFAILVPGTIVTPASGTTEIPNYLKHMQLQRNSGGTWQTLGTLAEPGTLMDPFGTPGDQYRFVPLSTAGTQGTPSSVIELID